MKTVLLIEGIHCAGCAGSIERALSRIDGVQEVSVDKEKGSAVVEHEEVVRPSQLVDLVSEIGFPASVAKR